MEALVRASRWYDPSRGIAFSTYAWRCITHAILHVRRRLATSKRSRPREFLDPDMAERPRAAAVEPDERELLNAGLRRLDARDRAILESWFRDGQSIEEIGDVLGISKQRAHQLKERAIARLRAFLQTRAPEWFAFASGESAPR